MPDICQIIDEVPELANAVILDALAGGPASDSWLVERGGDRIVVRIDKPRAAKLGLDRRTELKVLEQVASAGIGPDVVWADPANGILITSYINGEVWTLDDMYREERLEELSSTLRRLYAAPANGPEFDPALAAFAYAREIGTDQATELATHVEGLTNELLGRDHQRVLCHNDLVHRNIIGKGPVMLIDWEYAAVGDPLFDLAIIVRHHELSEPLARALVGYCFESVHTERWGRFEIFCSLYDHLSALWYLSVCNEADVDSCYAAELQKVLYRLQS